jgi:hypothetical protein
MRFDRVGSRATLLTFFARRAYELWPSILCETGMICLAWATKGSAFLGCG